MTRMKKCPKCKGTGLEYNHSCPKCHGQKYVEEKK